MSKAVVVAMGLWLLPGADPEQGLTEEEVVPTLPEVVVTGRAPGSLHEQHWTIEDIRANSPADLGELLRRLPGVSGSRMGGHGIDPIIRGQGRNRLNVLLDGAYVLGGCPNRMDPPTSYSSVDADDEITLIRGSQTVRWGGGGSGGTVLLRRRTPRFREDERVRGRVTGGASSNSRTEETHVDVAAGRPWGFVRGRFDHADARSYRDGDGKRVRSAFSSRGGGFVLGWTPEDDRRLELGYDATEDREVLFAGAGMDAPVSDHDLWRLRYEQDRLPGPFAGLRGDLYWSDVVHRMDNFSLRTQTAPRKMLVDSDSTTVGGRISGELEASFGTWTLGLDVQRNERDATRFWDFSTAAPTDVQSTMWPGVELEQAGVFAELEAPIGEQGLLTLGARFDRMDASLDRSVAATRPAGPAWQLSPDELYDLYYGIQGEEAEADEVGFVARHEHSLQDGCTVYASASSSVRQADATERYLAAHNMDPTLRWIGNPGLEPERHRQVELGLSKEQKSWTCASSLFYDRVDDFILRDRAHGQPGILQSDGATIYRNVEASLWGGEVEVSCDWDEAWSSRLTLAYVRAENREEHRPIAQIPPLEGEASLDWEGSGKEAGIVLRWAADQHHTDTDPAVGSGLDAHSTPGWAVLDLYVSFDVSERSRLRVGVENLFDHTYAHHVNRANVDPFNPDPVQVNEPGLLFWFSLTFSF